MVSPQIGLLGCLLGGGHAPILPSKGRPIIQTGSYQSDGQGSQSDPEPSLGSFVQLRLGLQCAGRGKSLCQINRSAGTWRDASQQTGDKDMKIPSPNPGQEPPEMLQESQTETRDT
jgi:hypothetical protein